MTRYRFKARHGVFRPGEIVPHTFAEGIIQTMLSVGRIEAIPDEPPKFEPANKQVKPEQVKAKAKHL